MFDIDGMSSTSGLTPSSDEGIQYEPLPHPITHIRLLEVNPSLDAAGHDDDATIRCRLRSVRLVDYDQCYTALSYTWSDDGSKYTISVNGKDVDIRSNLHDFLCLYRQKLMLKSLPTVFLWIDALCLNYADISERNSQAQIMPTIYQRAKTNLTWIQPDPGADEAFKGKLSQQKFFFFMQEVRIDLDRSRNYHNDHYLLSKYGTSTRDNQRIPYFHEWQTMLHICNNKYWTRLWIILENRFAQNLMLMHADRLWSWEDFRAPFILAWVLEQIKPNEQALPAKWPSKKLLQSAAIGTIEARLTFENSTAVRALHGEGTPYTRYITEKWQLTSDRAPLIDLLKRHDHRECSEVLDKVYALVGLSDSGLTIDYSRSPVELFAAALLDVRMEMDMSFAVTLAKELQLSTFEPKTRPIATRALSSLSTRSHASSPYLAGQVCRKIYAVKSMPNRTEIHDVIQARLGLTKLNYYRVSSSQSLDKLQHWTDFPPRSPSQMQSRKLTPGAPMPILDGFDLSATKFTAAMFVNPSSGRGHRKALLGLVSTDQVEDNDIIVTDAGMNAAVIFRISGLAKTWLTVTGIVLFVRRVTVSTSFSTTLDSGETISASRSSSLTDFCEFTQPTPFKIVEQDDSDRFVLKPLNLHLEDLLSGSRASSTPDHRPSQSASPVSFVKPDERRWTSRSDKLERMLGVFGHRRSKTK